MNTINKYRFLATAVMAVMTAMTAWAFEVDGISYDPTSDTEVAVTGGEIKEEIVIPATVTYEGVTYNVTSIADGAFSYRNNQSNFTRKYVVPGSVKSIGNSAFYDNYYAEEIVLNEGLETIGSSAFGYNYELKEITIPSTVTRIDDGAFMSNQDKAINVTCYARVPAISSSTFQGRTHVATLRVPTEDLEVFKAADYWKEFTNIQSFDLTFLRSPLFSFDSENYLLSILSSQDASIYYTTDGTTPTAASTLYTSPIAFTKNQAVKAIAIKDESSSLVRTYEKTDFKVATPTSSIDENMAVTLSCEASDIDGMPETKIYYRLTDNNWDSYSTIAEGGADWTLYEGPIQMTQAHYIYAYAVREGWIDSDRTYFNYVDGYSTTQPWTEWVREKGKLRIYNYDDDATVYYTLDGTDPTKDSYVYNPDDSISIDHNLTVKCVAMRANHFNSGIASAVITDATSKFKLQGITYRRIDNSVALEVEVTSNADGSVKYVGEVTIPSEVTFAGQVYTVTRIGEYAFNECYDLARVNLPASLTSIGRYAFNRCQRLATVDFPESLRTIENRAFYNCSNMQQVVLPDGLTTLGDEAFSACSGLRQVVLSATLEQIPYGAFADCTSLSAKLVIPGSVGSIGSYAFRGCSRLPSITFSEGLATIDEHAFESCSALSSITLPQSMQTINYRSFANCSGLSSITMLEGITEIGQEAFYGCNTLTTLSLPNTLATISHRAFYDCSALTTLQLPEGVRTLGDQAFQNCGSLRSVYALASTPPSMNSDSHAFLNETGVITLYVKSADETAYKNDANWCQFDNIMTFDVTPSVQPSFSFDATTYQLAITSRDAGAAIYYTLDGTDPTESSTQYTAPLLLVKNGTVKAIAVGSGLAPSEIATFNKSDFTVPSPVMTIDTETFVVTLDAASPEIEGFPETKYYYSFSSSRYSNNGSWTLLEGNTLQLDRPCFLYVYAERDGWNNSPEAYQNFYDDYYTQTPNISWDAENMQMTLSLDAEDATIYYTLDGSDPTAESLVYDAEKKITIDHNTTVRCIAVRPGHFFSTIKEYQVDNVTVKFLVDGIAYRRIDGNQNDEVEVTSNPSGEKYAGDFVIPTTVTYGGKTYTVTRIGESAFRECYELASVTIPETVTSIGRSAFYYDYGEAFKEITIPGSVKVIEEYAFYYANRLKTVNLSEGLQKIAGNAFDRCHQLVNISLPSTLTSIGSYAFRDCDNIVSLKIPDATTTIGEHAFEGCDRLASVVLPAHLTVIEPSLFNNTALTTVNIPEGVTSIGNWAFGGCSSLMTVQLPSTLTSLGEYAFSDCSSLASITIPEGMTSLPNYAFQSCRSLATVSLPSTLTSIGYWTFNSCSSLRVLTLPASLTEIGQYAFSGCSALESIYAYPVTPPELKGSSNETAFADHYSTAVLYLKDTAKEAYEANVKWNLFGTKQTYEKDPAAQPTFSFDGDTYLLTISCVDDDVAIYYTLDGSNPTAESTAYTEPLHFMQNGTVKAIAVNSDGMASLVTEFNLTFTVPTPTAVIDDATFLVTLDSREPDIEGFPATKYYYQLADHDYEGWLDQSKWIELEGNTLQLERPYYLHFYAEREGWSTSSKTVANFYSNYRLNAPNMDYNSDTRVMTLSQNGTVYESGKIYYTLDGTDPTPATGTLYTEPLAIDRNYTVKAITTADNHFNSDVNRYDISGIDTRFGIAGIYYRLRDDTNGNEVMVAPVPDGVSGYSGNIEIPASITYQDQEYAVTGIYDNAFNSAGISSISLPNGLRTIGQSAFRYCHSLTAVDIPGSVEQIGYEAFYNCTQLRSVTLHDGIKIISERAFYNNDQLQTINLPATLTTIGNYAFQSCDRLASVVWPASVTTINVGVFEDCYGLASITLPAAVTEIREAAFKNCRSLQTITLPEALTAIAPQMLSDCTSLTSVKLPAGATVIRYNAFYNCQSLVSILLPAQLTRIEYDAFYGCSSLASVTLPATLTNIDNNAFGACNSLTSIYAMPVTPPSIEGNGGLDGLYELATVYAPIAALDAYRGAGTWKNFGESIKEFTQQVVEQPTFALLDYKLSISTITEGATIYYTTDGSEPTNQSVKYTAPLAFAKNGTVKAMAVADGMADSRVNTFEKSDYTVAQPTAVIDPTTFKVTISCESPNVEGMPQTFIWYAVNQSSWNVSDEEYQLYDGQPIQLSRPCYVHTFASREGWLQSGRSDINFNNNYSLSEPTLYWNSEEKTMTITQSSADSIYYTLDGSEPSRTNGTKYTGPITLSRNLIVRAIAFQDQHFDSNIAWGESNGFDPRFTVDGINYRVKDYTLANEVEVVGAEIREIIEIPETVTNDGQTYTVVAIGNNALEGRRDENNCTRKYVIPKTVKTIGNSAFYDNYYVKEIVFNEGLESIGNSAFQYNWALTEITIPSTVTDIGNYAFNNDYNIKNVYCLAKTPIISRNTFVDVSNNATLNVYSADTAAFKAAEYWQNFARIEPFDEVPPRFSFDASTYQLAMSSPITGVTIYYTRDGSAPTTNSSIYTTPITLLQNDTIRAFALKDGKQSPVSIYEPALRVAQPRAVLDLTTQTMTITCADSDVEGMPATRIWYVVDEQSWNRSDGFILYDGNPVPLSKAGYVHMYAERDGWIMSEQRIENFWDNYYQDAPGINWDGGTSTFSLTHGDSEAQLYYTLDGTEPSQQNGTLYSEPVKLNRNLIVKAVAVKADRLNSGVSQYNVTDVDSRFMYEGLAYRLVDNTTANVVEVTSGGSASGKVVIPQTVTTADNTSYTVTRVGDSAFYGDDDITEVVLPGTITRIGNNAFQYCRQLLKVNLPDALTEIGSQAFNTTNLDSIVVPGSVKVISYEAFRDISNLKSLVIKEGVEEIGEAAFVYAGMPSLELPSTVTKIGYNCFNSCSNLVSVTLPEGLTDIDSYTFQSCGALKSVSLPSTLQRIGYAAFNDCRNLELIVLPAGLTRLEDQAFSNDVNLNHVYTLATVPPTIDNGSSPFLDVLERATLYVKPESEAVYKNATTWGAFSKIETFENLPSDQPTFVYSDYMLAMDCQTEGVSIYYTLDGTEPTTSSPLYTEPVAITRNTTVKAMAAGSNSGRSLTSTWTISNLQVATPTASLSDDFTLTLTCEAPNLTGLPQTRIYYSLNRDGYGHDWVLYTAPFKMTKANWLYVRAERDGWNESGQNSYDYYSNYYLDAPNFETWEWDMPADSTIMMTHNNADAQIYYTIDGSDPNVNGILYTKPFNPRRNTTVKAIAKCAGRINSDPAERTYNWFTVHQPEVEIKQLKAVLTVQQPAASTIYYTLDGSEPTRESNVYTGPIALEKDCTIRAKAVAANWNDSGDTWYNFNAGEYTVSEPSFDPSETADSTMTIYCGTQDAVIYYTTDGSTPTAQSTRYTGPIKLSQNTTVRAFATKTDMFSSRVVQVRVGWFTVKAPRIIFDGKMASFETETPGATIYYTLDNSDPDTKSQPYVAPFALPAEQTSVKAFAVRDQWNYSTVSDRTYFHGNNYCEAPVISRVGSTNQVQMTTRTADATIFYTTDGTMPTTASLVYGGEPITLTQNGTLRAMATQAKLYDSETASFDADWFRVDQPVITSDGINVTIFCAREGATIYYTLDGTDPTEDSQQYTKQLVMTGSCTIKAIAAYDNFNNSGVARLDYREADNTAGAPAFSRDGNTVTIASTSGQGTTIYYTTDGSQPTVNSTVYTAAITVGENQTLKALAVNAKLFQSEVTTYTVDWFKVEAPTITFDGKYVTMASATPSARLYYTLDGSTPTEESLRYTSQLTMTGDCTVKVIGLRDNFNASAVVTNVFDRAANTVAAPQVSRTGNVVTITTATTAENTVIHYTTDGSVPTVDSPTYEDAITVGENQTLKALAVNAKLFDSDVTTYTVDWFKAATPVLTLNGSTLTISTTTADATIYYSYGEERPTTASTAYTGPIQLVDNRPVKAIAVRSNFNDSEVASVTPTYFVCQPVTFSYNGRYLQLAGKDGETIRYTTDGSRPTEQSEQYSSPLDIAELCTVKAIAVRRDFQNSSETEYKVTYVYNGEEVSLDEAGHLEEVFAWTGGAQNIQSLPVQGNINAKDLQFIQGLQNLKHLDLTNATFEGDALPDEAFAGLPLLSFASPKQLKSVGEHLFKGCTQLGAIVWNANMAVPESVIDDVKGNPNFLLYVNSRIHVPSNYSGNVISGGQATSITLSDAPGAGNFCCPQSFYTQRISYTHSYTQPTESGVTCGWETLALPFDVQTITHERRGALAPFGAGQDITVLKPFWLYELKETGFAEAGEIKAYTPYIISMPNNPDYADDYILAGKVTFSAADTYVEADTAYTTVKGSVQFAPAMQRQEQSASVLAINREDYTDEDGVFYRSGSAFLPNMRAVSPFEAYALVGASAPKLLLGDLLWGNLTDMRNAQMTELVKLGRKAGVYDLSGRKLANDSESLGKNSKKMKRVYIVNGKKTVVE